LVLPLVSLLRASGQVVFVSVQDLKYGEDRKAQVAEAVRRSKRFLLFWSKSSKVSPLVGEEYKLALATTGCSVVPVLLDQTPLPPELERFHGTADLASLFQTLRRRNLIRILLLPFWAFAVLSALVALNIKFMGPAEDFTYSLLRFVPFVAVLVIPVLWGLSL